MPPRNDPLVRLREAWDELVADLAHQAECEHCGADRDEMHDSRCVVARIETHLSEIERDADG